MKSKVLNKLLIIIISMLFIIGLENCVNAASQPSEPIPYNNEIAYTENDDGTITVCKANTEITNATIPETINGKRVTRIGDFWSCPNLKTITIPNTVTSIRQGAFAECTSLESIVIPDSVTTIEYEAFLECTSLKEVKLPNNLKTIDSYTFFHCTSLKEIEIPNPVEEIGWCAFQGSGIEKIILPESVKTVSLWAFGDCESLREIYFPKGIEYIHNNEDGSSFGNIPTEQLTIYGYKGTIAEEVANDLGYKFVERKIPFLDVNESNWYFNSVKFVSDSGIIYGTTDTTFSPNSKLTRGNLVTILWRMEGSPAVSGEMKFLDVKESDYYYEAVKWAEQNRVVSGYDDGRFRPNNYITREQLATILKNYADYKKKDTSARADLTIFKDYTGISSYAKDGIAWAVANKVMSGKNEGTRVDPRGNATRAEAAAMIQNYCYNVGR